MNIYFISLILIKLCVLLQSLQIAFFNLEAHFLKMTQFHTLYFL